MNVRRSNFVFVRISVATEKWLHTDPKHTGIFRQTIQDLQEEQVLLHETDPARFSSHFMAQDVVILCRSVHCVSPLSNFSNM